MFALLIQLFRILFCLFINLHLVTDELKLANPLMLKLYGR